MASFLIRRFVTMLWTLIGISVLVFIIIQRVTTHERVRSRADYLRLAYYSVLGVSANQLLYVTGLTMTTATAAQMLITGGPAVTRTQNSGEFEGVRAYRRGDPLKLVVWKKAAKSPELVSRDKVDILAGFIFTPNAMAAASVADRAKRPLVVMNAAASGITKRSPYVTRTSYTIAQSVVPLAQWAYKTGSRRVYSLVADYAPGLDGEEDADHEHQDDAGDRAKRAALAANPGAFTIGRGMFNDGVTDWADAKIDEVRVSDTAARLEGAAGPAHVRAVAAGLRGPGEAVRYRGSHQPEGAGRAR